MLSLMWEHIRKLQRVQDYASLLKISRITLNHSVMAQYGVSATYLLKQCQGRGRGFESRLALFLFKQTKFFPSYYNQNTKKKRTLSSID